jgi:hypothetical protein
MPSVACEIIPGIRILPSGSFTCSQNAVRSRQVALRPHPQHQINELVELDIEGMGAVPAAPAQTIADAVLREVAQRMVKRLDPHLAVFAKGRQTNVDADAVPKGR